MSAYNDLRSDLVEHQSKWLVTGAAGFIGSHLVETLLGLGQTVVGLDNFATGYQANLADIRSRVGEEAWLQFSFHEADVCDLPACQRAADGADYVLHQAALGSVPRSIEDPIRTNSSNIDGFLNMLVASRDAGVKRFVYAASSSTYGDHPGLPKVEDTIGRPLSPYAVTKYVNELYADVFARSYGLESIGLSLLVDPEFQLPMLNAVTVPGGVDEAAVRGTLLEKHDIEIGAGLGPLAGKIWRIGLMGHSCRAENVLLCVGALEAILSDLDAPITTGQALTRVQQALWG